jgi:hypothetical protein
MLAPRIKQVERKIMPSNHTKTVDAAKLLNIPILCAHTVADNCVATFLDELMNKKKPETIKDIMEILKVVPEYAYAGSNNAGPKIIVGKEANSCGKIFIDMTGGAEGAKELYEKMSQAGIGTIIGMHFSDDHKKELENQHINAVVAGHISSDNIGLNLLLDELVRKDKKIQIVACSGYYRISRL